MTHKCPVCGSDGILFGSTESQWADGRRVWDFCADSFECDACGLKLLDNEELQLAGITWVHDAERPWGR